MYAAVCFFFDVAERETKWQQSVSFTSFREKRKKQKLLREKKKKIRIKLRTYFNNNNTHNTPSPHPNSQKKKQKKGEMKIKYTQCNKSSVFDGLEHKHLRQVTLLIEWNAD